MKLGKIILNNAKDSAQQLAETLEELADIAAQNDNVELSDHYFDLSGQADAIILELSTILPP